MWREHGGLEGEKERERDKGWYETKQRDEVREKEGWRGMATVGVGNGEGGGGRSLMELEGNKREDASWYTIFPINCV